MDELEPRDDGGENDSPSTSHQNRRRRTADVAAPASVSSFEDLALPSWLVSGLEDCGFLEPSPVQASAIPLALSGADLLVRAKSGTGKTAAFGVPAVLSASSGDSAGSSKPRVLVLAPTREVALQAADVASALLARSPLPRHERPSVAAFVGGLPPAADVARCRRPLSIVAATPGRARALATSPSPSAPALDLSDVSLLVLDEADALLEPPLAADVRFLAAACGCGASPSSSSSRPPQVLAFSATLDAGAEAAVSRLVGAGSGRPLRRVDVSPRGPALEGVTHYYLPVSDGSGSGPPLPPTRRQRERKVVEALSAAPFCQAAVFVSSRSGASSLAAALERAGFPTRVLSGALPQAERMESIAALRSFEARVAVATDLGARGVDLERVNVVVNADGVPRERRGRKGEAREGEERTREREGEGDDEEGLSPPPPSPSRPLPDGAATLAHRAGRAGRFGGRGVCITLVEAADGEGEGEGGASADGGESTTPTGELRRLQRALLSLGCPNPAERLPTSLPASAYAYEPPTDEEREIHEEMVRRREERRATEQGEGRGSETRRRRPVGPERERSGSGGSVLRYSPEELRGMRARAAGGKGEGAGDVDVVGGLPAALSRSGGAPPPKKDNRKPPPAPPRSSPAPKTPPAKTKARPSPPAPPPLPPFSRSGGGEDAELDLDDEELEAAIRAVHAAAAASEEESEGEESDEGEGDDDGDPPPPPPPSPPPPSRHQQPFAADPSALPRPVPCPSCRVMVPPERSRRFSPPPPPPATAAAATEDDEGPTEPLVAVPASLLRRYYELEWDAWAQRSERWRDAAAWHAWWASKRQHQ